MRVDQLERRDQLTQLGRKSAWYSSNAHCVTAAVLRLVSLRRSLESTAPPCRWRPTCAKAGPPDRGLDAEEEGAAAWGVCGGVGEAGGGGVVVVW